jgi:predicted Ser/Thr protein kinase
MSDGETKATEPESFGRFRVTGVLGRGGMGVVYHAQDPVIGRRVAIKVLRPDPALSETERRELQSRFEQEFRSAGTLSHPNVVTIYDVGRGENDAAFIAMECVEGQSLADLIASEQVLSFREVADMAQQISHALDYAHRSGIVHRDIKPANILISADGRPKITDFGVAKVVSANLTRTGTVIGTPTYMSPEQVTGQPITGASDQWSVAVILYHMLTGELPFSGESPTTILYKIVHQDPIPPHSLNLGLPETVDNVVLRALRKNPSERFASCGEMATVLRSALGAAPGVSDPVSGRTVTLTQSDLSGSSGTYGGAVSWWQRQRQGSRLGLAMGGAALVAATGWLVAGLVGSETSIEPTPAAAPVEAVRAATAFAGSLRVDSDTGEGAEIWIDGEDSGLRTPAAIPLDGSVGARVRLELRRYSEVVAETERILGPDLGEEWRPNERQLPARTFSVRSEPDGAMVTLNGETLEGVTPLEVELVPGRHYDIVVERPGYERKRWAFDFPDKLKPQVRESEILAFNLESSAPPGAVVAEAPYDIVIEAAGRRAGPSRTPRLELPAGEHDITISAPGVFYSSERRGVRIASGEVYEIRTLPEARTVNIASYPANARVYIDRVLAGDLPLEVRLTLTAHDFVFEFPDGTQERLDRYKIGRSTDRVFVTAGD